LKLLADILSTNYLQVDDTRMISESIAQNVGLMQGDSLSPLLFLTMTADLPGYVQAESENVHMLMYADDVVMWSKDRKALQTGLCALEKWSSDNCLTINTHKTKAMKFRQGGRIAKDDKLVINNEFIEFVNSFRYLGILVHYSGKSFSKHIEDRCRKAITVVATLRLLSRLSIKTALKLFVIKVAPVATYGIQLAWSSLTVNLFERIEKVKATYLKRCLCLPKSSRSRLAYILCDARAFIEEIRATFQLEETEAYAQFIQKHYEKRSYVHQDFYGTPAMIQDNWRASEQKERHIVTRYSAHGFHHKICERQAFHDAGEACKCNLCGESPIGTYHLLRCPRNVRPLASYAS